MFEFCLKDQKITKTTLINESSIMVFKRPFLGLKLELKLQAGKTSLQHSAMQRLIPQSFRQWCLSRLCYTTCFCRKNFCDCCSYTVAAAGQESRLKFTQAIRRKHLLFVLTVLHGSFTVNQKRDPMETAFCWSLANRQGKSKSHSKGKLCSPVLHSKRSPIQSRQPGLKLALQHGHVGIIHAVNRNMALALQLPWAFTYRCT